MSRKAALVFNWMLTFLVIFILTFSFFKFSSKYAKFSVIGKKQLDLFTTYQKTESALFYIDQSAKYALQQSVYDMARNGGIAETKSDGSCKQFYGYSTWNDIQKDGNGNTILHACFDEKQINGNLIYFFDKSLSSYLEKYPQKITSAYNYELKEGIELTAKASKPIIFEIKK